MNKKWDIYMVGTLVEENVIINSHDSLQFYIKVISNFPESFPNVKYFTVYTSDIEHLEFEDDENLSREERKLELKKFFEKNLLIFQPVQRGEKFYITNVVQVKKTDNFKNDSTYIPVPIFTANNLHRNFEEFKRSLINKEYVDNVYGISNEDSDTPSIVLWQDSENTRVLGSFTSHVYSMDKIKFEFDFLQSMNFDNNWYVDIIRSAEIKTVIFVGTDIYTQIENQIELANEKNGEILLKKEINFINTFIKHTKEAALVYDESDLVNFHTAMKSSNLVILSGMSGTGKSKLVQMYGEALGLKSSQVNIIPVRPSWADDRDLLGYVDSIHNVYKPGDSGLIDTLIAASNNKDKLYIICFDEMNLARVEYYFSQFLSVLEMDKNDRKIILYSENLENILYNSAKYKHKISIMDNVLFVGTVNIDESTYHFSDKVLDRANVITLNANKLLRIKDVKLDKKTTLNEISSNEYIGYKFLPSEIRLSDLEIELLEILNNEMNKANKNIGIGYRILRQIDTYLNNIPKCEYLNRRQGFDLQIVQRVLTKIRGPQEQIQNLIGIYDSQNDNVNNSIIIDLLNKYSEVSDFVSSKKCIKEKAKELRVYGYAI